jgi:ornithine--oxo-acid transaminase
MRSQEYIDLEERYGAHNYHPLDVVLERGEGCWVWDVDGVKYLDCLSAYSSLNQGHVHPRILSAMTEQAKKMTLTSRAFRNDQLPLFYQELSEMTGYEMSLPMNSGAEAVETAIKLARDHRGRGQLPRAHHHHHLILERRALQARFRTLHTRLRPRQIR